MKFRVRDRDLKKSGKALWRKGPLGMENIWRTTGHSKQEDNFSLLNIYGGSCLQGARP